MRGVPGPWVRDEDTGRITGAGGRRVLFSSLSLATGYGPDGDEISANDALAIAAPELADALERLIDAQTGLNVGDLAGALAAARSALRKAGVQP